MEPALSPENIPVDPTLTKVIPAALGAMVSLRFVQGTLAERALMAAGGVSLAYYATPVSSEFLRLGTSEGVGLVGFVIGLFGMVLVAKVYEAVQGIDAKAVATDLVDALKKRLGIGQ